MKKALVFMAQSEDLACCYAEEMRTWDWIRWEQGQLGGMQNVNYAKEHLHILAEHRPVSTFIIVAFRFINIIISVTQDPYYPPTKHGLGWHLKRSRSVGCLRELYPVAVIPDDDGLLQPDHKVDETQEN
ncbi:hypothetical protein PILCRDRAFT_819001 [Piloderma croceum F 1598]|uniref:Uncharacterized protein n=1 Tax=Piloderma croceum (strain F 1598) TaxID=765440 RepID=A0A0C3FHT0_PILCF|nr:hypothetical protein PILCRDRAFT_819001 [Piloderma croceum F 1598]